MLNHPTFYIWLLIATAYWAIWWPIYPEKVHVFLYERRDSLYFEVTFPTFFLIQRDMGQTMLLYEHLDTKGTERIKNLWLIAIIILPSSPLSPNQT